MVTKHNEEAPPSDEKRIEDLWQFALALYEQEGVSDAALQLQDQAGIDVPELLWMCWLDQRGEHTEHLSDLQGIREWQTGITQPLRNLRRTLKPITEQNPHLGKLREDIKKAELLAEKETLRRLSLLKCEPGAPSEAIWTRWALQHLSAAELVLVSVIREKAHNAQI